MKGRPSVDVAHPQVVLVTMLAAASAVMASAVLTIAALPAIGQHLHASQTQLQWIVDITPTVLAALVLFSGAVLDRYGRRRGLILGLFILGAALTWSGFAGSASELLAARFFTGVGAAIAFPGTLATVTAITPAENRARAVGMWAGATMVGGTWGLLLAGGMLQTPLWWGSFFVVTALVVAVCLIGTLLTVPETRDPEPVALDLGGALLSLLAVGGLVLGITELPVRNVADPVVAGGFLTAAVALPGFIAWELRASRPMLDVRLFSNRMFAGGAAGVFLLFVGCYGWFFLSFQYYAYVLGYNPLQGGLGLLPNAASTVPCAVIGARLAARRGWRPIIVFSLIVVAIGSALMAALGPERSFWWIALAFFVFGIGLGTGQAAPTQAIVEALPPSKQGVASAVNDAARELGAAVGIAIMGSAFNFAYRAKVGGLLGGLPAPLADAVRNSPAAGLEAAGRVHAPATGTRVGHAVATATVSGWSAAFWVATGLFVVSAIIIHFAGREPAGTAVPARVPRRSLHRVALPGLVTPALAVVGAPAATMRAVAGRVRRRGPGTGSGNDPDPGG